MKKTFIKRVLWLLIPLLTVFNINAWGASTTGYFKKVTSATLSAGDTVIIVNTAESKALQNISTTNTKYGTLTDVSATSNVVTLSSANVEMFVLETGYNSSGFSFKGTSNISNNYLTWTSGNSLNKNGTKSANTSWTITWSSGTATIANNSTSTRLIRFNSDRVACYTSSTGTLAQVYKKAYKVTYNGNGSTGGSVPTDANYYYKNASVTAKTNSGTLVRTGYTFNGWNTKADGSGTAVAATGSATFTLTYNTTLYAQWVSSGCSNKVNITAGTPETGGSFTLDKTGNQDCCSALTVTVSNITAPSGKQFSAITQTGIAAANVTIDQNAKTVTYAANSNGSSTINVTFVDLPKYTVTLEDDGTELEQASYGASVTLPSRTGCTGYTFAGWTKTWTSPQSSWTTTAPTIISAGSYTPEADENLYPVYTKTESGGGPSNDYELYSGSLTEGDYIIYYDGYAMNTTVTSDRLQYEEVTPDDDVITTTDESIIWHVAASGDYWTIYNANADAYAASTGAKNKAQMLADGTDDKSLWTVSGTSTYEFVNKQNTANSVNANLRNNGTYGFACYATSTGGALSLYKNVSGGSTTYYISVPNCCTDWSTPTVSYSSSLAIGGTANVAIGSGTTHGAISYESSNEDILTVESDGTITAMGAGTAHIIATWAGDATYCEKSANSNDITVSGIEITGTLPVNFGQVYQNAVIGDKTLSVTGLGLTSDIIPSLPSGSPFSVSPASFAQDCSGATLTISANTATIGEYSHTLTLTSGSFTATATINMNVIAMPSCTFVDGLHNLTEDNNHVALSSFDLEAVAGTAVVFPVLADQSKSSGTCEGEYYKFVGWTTSDNNTDPQAHLVTSHTLAIGDNITYHAVWADATGSATYTKLTSTSFSGSPAKYVLGGENSGTQYFLHSYSGTDADVSWGECSSSETPIQFTLSGTAAALVAQDASGNYLAETSSAKKFRMNTSSSTVKLKSDGSIETTSYYLRFNYNNGTPGLRCYATEAQEPAYFYLVGAAGTVHYRTSCCANKVDAPVVTATKTSTTITLTWPDDAKATGWQVEWNGAGGWVTPSGTCTHTVSGLTPNTTYTWRVRATYGDPQCGADIASGSTTTDQVYHVSYAPGDESANCTATGSTTDETTYEAGATVTLQSNGFTLHGHEFNAWTTDDPDVTISNNQITMPDHDVVITATWRAKVDKYFDRMHDQTDALHGGVEETTGINEGKYYIPKEGCNYTIPTASDSKTGDACQTSHYKLRGWIAASYMKGYPNNMTGEIGTGNESHIFEPTGTRTATGATYYAIWAKVVE